MVYVFLADGFEEIEALTPVDILRRGGVDVVTVGVTGREATSSHNIVVTADIMEEEIDDFDGVEAIVLPGGMPGTNNLEASEVVKEAIEYCSKNDILIGAICAAPSILGHMGLLKGKHATAFPSFQKELDGAICNNGFVEKDGKIITARGMGVSVEFGLELLKELKGNDVANSVRNAIQCR